MSTATSIISPISVLSDFSLVHYMHPYSQSSASGGQESEADVCGSGFILMFFHAGDN